MTSSMQGLPESTGANGAPRHGDQLQGAASGLLNQAARTADAQASTTMTKAGQTLESVARAIDDAANGMRESQPDIANLVQTAGDRVSDAAMYLRDHTASDALENVQHVARRQPALVVGGGLALGLVIGRFLRTGAAVAQSDMRSTGSRSGYGYGSGYGDDAYGSRGLSGVSGGGAGTTAGYGETGGIGAAGGYGASAGYEAVGGYDPSGGYGTDSAYGTETGMTDTGSGTRTADELAATDIAGDEAIADVDLEQTGRSATTTRRSRSAGGSR